MDRYLVQKINHDVPRFEWVASCTYVASEDETPVSISNIVWTADIDEALGFELEIDASRRARLIDDASVVRHVIES